MGPPKKCFPPLCKGFTAGAGRRPHVHLQSVECLITGFASGGRHAHLVRVRVDTHKVEVKQGVQVSPQQQTVVRMVIGEISIRPDVGRLHDIDERTSGKPCIWDRIA